MLTNIKVIMQHTVSIMLQLCLKFINLLICHRFACFVFRVLMANSIEAKLVNEIFNLPNGLRGVVLESIGNVLPPICPRITSTIA